MKTLFEKIIDRELEADIVAESEGLIAIKDKYPKAPVHLLIITKKPITNLANLTKEDLPLIADVVIMAQELAKEFSISDNFRLLTNNGPLAGQSVFHLHFHLIGGKKLDFETN
jgi:histidine triad (HIT) family protein